MYSAEKKSKKLARLLKRTPDDNQKGQPTKPSFAEQAQAALEAVETPSRASSERGKGTLKRGKGTLYRSGCTLANLEPGQCGTIRLLVATNQGRLRLLEMGLTPGVHVKVLRVAAFGGPMDILVRGYQLSLRRDEATTIWLGEEDD